MNMSLSPAVSSDIQKVTVGTFLVRELLGFHDSCTADQRACEIYLGACSKLNSLVQDFELEHVLNMQFGLLSNLK
jgi:hypothetical protein